MKNYSRNLRFWFGILLLSLLITGVASAEGKWMVAQNTLSAAGQITAESISIWNPSYNEGESVEWFGDKKYSQSLGSYVAQGYGRAVWYLNGNFEQSDQGGQFAGRRHGDIVQSFADGRTVNDRWEYGERVNVTAQQIFEKNQVQVGDVVASLTVQSLSLSGGYLKDITFAGEIELTGISEWVDNTGDGSGWVFRFDESSANKIPVLANRNKSRGFRMKISEDRMNLLPREAVKARIIVDNLSIGERQIEMSAKLVKVIKVSPE